MTRIASLTLFLLLIAVHASAVNLVGDADNSGVLEIPDGALVQGYLYGSVGPTQISPLALADGDGDLDLSDLMLGAQAVNSVAMISGPGSLLSITHASDPTLADGDPDYPVVFDVASNYPTATMVDGLGVSVSMTPGESVLSGASTAVLGDQATATFTPLNASAPDDVYSIDAQIIVRNSDDSVTVETALDAMTIMVRPIICGDGVVNGAEWCDTAIHDCCDLSCEGPDLTMSVCRPSADECDPAEICDSIGITCPGDAWLLDGTICTDDGLFCTGSESCLLGGCQSEGYPCTLPGEVCNETTDVCDVVPYCGDWNVDAGEDCDDGNTISGDGCSLACADESTACIPREIGQWGGGEAVDVEVVGTIAYLANGVRGLDIYEVSNPASPQLLGSLDTAGYATYLTVIGSVAYVADGNNGLVMVDVSNSNSPFLLGSYDTAGFTQGVAVSGSVAYVADEFNGLAVVDVSNPASPSPLGSYITGGKVRAVAVSGNIAYIENSPSGLVLVDVSNPASPSLLGSYNTAGNAYDVVVNGSVAYVADYENGLVVIDPLPGDCAPVCGNGIVEYYEACDAGPFNGSGPGFCLADCSGIQP